MKPIPEITPITTATDIPDKISRFYHYNDVKKFQCDRPVHKGIIDKENEIKVMIFQVVFSVLKLVIFRLCG